MSEPAPEVKIDPVSLYGLEEVFDVEPVPSTGAISYTGTAEPITGAPEPVTDFRGVPVEEAAVLFGTSVNALKKRLRKGTLLGSKVEAKHGEKWFVDHSELPNQARVPSTSAEHVTSAKAPVTDALEPVPPVMAPVTDKSKPVPDAIHGELLPGFERLVISLEKKDAVIESQAHQLKAAGDVIMYLRSQIEDKENQLKLLTDSQHKSGWWSRFCAWFKV